MVSEKVVSELAAEIAMSLLSIAPGTGTIIDILPDTSKKMVRKLFGAEQSDTLQVLIETTLTTITQDILRRRNAKKGTHEYGATYHGIEDFRTSLAVVRLDSQLLLEALTDPTVLRNRIAENTPKEHKKWASNLRRDTYNEILDRFTLAIIDLAPNVPVVRSAIAVETLREVRLLKKQHAQEVESTKN